MLYEVITHPDYRLVHPQAGFWVPYIKHVLSLLAVVAPQTLLPDNDQAEALNRGQI